jgi:hypothetical protein
MNNPVTAILDGLSVAGIHLQLTTIALMLLLVSLAFLISILRRIFETNFSAEEYLSFGLAGWLLPASLISLFWYLDRKFFPQQIGSLLFVVVLIVGLALTVRHLKPMAPSSKTVTVSLMLLAVLFIVLRLAFVSKAIFPLYFDSAQHYRYIHDLLASLENTSAGSGSPEGYYHLGFHFLAAFLTSIARAEITDTMLVLGQVILALIPFSAFFIVRHGSGSNSAGFLALVLAAFGWYMPAHAMDWGKYPALASLALLPFVVSLAYISIQNRKILLGRKYLGLNLLLLAAILISILYHSRSLVIYALLVPAWLTTLAWNRLGRKSQLLLAGVVLLLLLGEILFIRSQGVLGPLLDAYGTNAILITVPVLILSIFAWRTYPRLTIFCLAFIALVLASLFVSLGNLVPGYAGTTLLDRPYVQMILYLPLTVLAGFGLASLEQMLKDSKVGWGNTQWRVAKVIGGLLILLVAIHALLQYDLYPSDCCAIVSQDDIAAITWLDASLPKDALILTSSTDLRVLPTEKYQGSAGGDAGTWITPLTGRPVAYLPYNTDFSQQEALALLCQQTAGYVYIGKTGWFFNDAGLSAQPENYKLLLDLPKAKVYEVTGCK